MCRALLYQPLALFLLLSDPALAASPNSTWSLRSWQSDEGLPDNAVVGIGETRDGFLWVATQGGLVRFDGSEFRDFPAMTAAGIPTGLMRNLCVDRHNRIWIAKDLTVLACMEAGRTTAFTTRDGLPVGRAKLLVADGEDSIWIPYNGREVARVRQGKIRRFSAADGLPGRDECQLAVDREGTVWYASAGELGIVRHERFVALTNLAGVQCLAGARGGGVWAAAGLRIFRFREGGSITEFGKLSDLPAPVSISVMQEDRSGALWVGTSGGGLFRHEGRDFQSIATSHPEILCLMEGREGAMWVGTLGGGLNRIRPAIVELEEINSGKALAGLRSICQDSSGALWAADRGGGLLRDAGEGWRPLSPEASEGISNATCVVADPQGGVWIGTQRNGLHFWRERRLRTLTEADGLGGNKVIRSLLCGPSGDLWIATTAESLQHWRDGKLETLSLPNGCGPVRAMALDVTGTFWGGTASGMLLRVKDGAVQVETNAVSSEAIRALHVSADGSLWIGYGGGGAARLKQEKFVHFGVEQGLHEDYISAILEDHSGRLWFGGNRGIFYARAADFEKVAAGLNHHVQLVVFGREDGLPALEAGWDFWPVSVSAASGQLYLATRTGLAVIHTDSLRPDLTPPRVVLESVAVDGREVAAYDSPDSMASLRDPGLRLEIPADHQQVSFTFAAPSAANVRGAAFKHRLERLDNDWVDVGSRNTAYYSHIPPGDYEFRVIGGNSDGVWNETGASVAIHSKPHVWQTAWFRAAIVLFGGVVIALAVLAITRGKYHRRIEALERQRLLEKERARIAQDLHDDLGAGLAEISFGSELTQDPGLSPDEARQYTSEIGARAREMVIALDEIVWAVNPRHDTVPSLASYFCQFAQDFLKATRIRCDLEIAKDLRDAPLNAEQRHSLFLAFKEALVNASRHSGATQIKLSIATSANLLAISLADNGSGLAGNGTQTANGQGEGLGNMRNRLEQLGGRCRIESLPGHGTSVFFEVRLPEINAPSVPTHLR